MSRELAALCKLTADLCGQRRAGTRVAGAHAAAPPSPYHCGTKAPERAFSLPDFPQRPQHADQCSRHCQGAPEACQRAASHRAAAPRRRPGRRACSQRGCHRAVESCGGGGGASEEGAGGGAGGGERRRRRHPSQPAASCCNAAQPFYFLTLSYASHHMQAGAAGVEPAAEVERAAKRIDGGDLRRETLFSGVEGWLGGWVGGEWLPAGARIEGRSIPQTAALAAALRIACLSQGQAPPNAAS